MITRDIYIYIYRSMCIHGHLNTNLTTACMYVAVIQDHIAIKQDDDDDDDELLTVTSLKLPNLSID
jgi:hypothetical protein